MKITALYCVIRFVESVGQKNPSHNIYWKNNLRFFRIFLLLTKSGAYVGFEYYLIRF